MRVDVRVNKGQELISKNKVIKVKDYGCFKVYTVEVERPLDVVKTSYGYNEDGTMGNKFFLIGQSVVCNQVYDWLMVDEYLEGEEQ